MAGSISDDSSHESLSSSAEIISTGQVSQASDSIGEWRSSEQVENGIPSTSPPYWDTDDDDDDFGPKPSDLYGKFTWKIENFSQISKRELRSNVFEVGGYKWYILIYPQGCDVCNHLSLFLCVANHDKLLPGWSHFAQFTIAVVNKDSKKSKYSDTLHRFWKKEHDWGWKKFMELSKLSDGFIVADALVIKAQVQVIREKAHRPFRCLDCQYRRELVRVYLSNVEQLCRRYVEEKRVKFSKVIEDKVRWSSFRAFWLGVDQSGRRWMSREKTETILKVVVKHFFIEKEVTSTLVMDSLYSGLKALEGLSKNKGTIKLLEGEEMATPFIYVEKDMFSLTDDVLVLLERIVLEPILPKDEKASQNQSQNRTKDSSSGEEFSKDSIERDERRLTELGRRTVEIFIINHIFSRIEVAYQEAVALKRQEELIREEEAAGQAEIELRSRRLAAEKEKRAKKKQAKQKRSARKGKERAREEKVDSTMLEKTQMGNILNELSEDHSSSVLDKVEMADVSDVSDVDEGEAHADMDERDSSPDVVKSNPPAPDNGSVSCPSDSNPTVAVNGPHKKNFFSPVIKTSSNLSARGKSQQTKSTRDKMLQSETSVEVSVSSREIAAESKVSVPPQVNSTQWLERQNVEKEALLSTQRKTTVRDQIDENGPTKPLTTEMPTPVDPSNYTQSQHTEKTLSSPAKSVLAQRQESTKLTVNPSKIITRPPSAPLIPGPRPASPHVSVAQQAPLLSRSVSAAGRLGFESTGSSLLTHGNTVIQSYRNAIMGKTAMSGSAASYTPRPTLSTASHGAAATYSQSLPAPVLQKSTRVDPVRSVLTFGSVSPETLQNRHQWGKDLSQQLHSTRGSLVSSIRSLDISAVPSPRPYLSDEASQPLPMQDEFPHLDIINDLLDEGHPMTGTEGLDAYPQHHHQHHDHHHTLARHYTFPREISSNGGRLFYGDGVQRIYGSPSNHYSGDLMDYSAYINGQSQWQMGGADHLPLDGGGYPYHDTSDMASGMNGYGMFHRPGNGP